MGQTEAKSLLLKSHIPNPNGVVYQTLKKGGGMETRDTNVLKQASFYWHDEEAISVLKRVMLKPASHSLFHVS